MPGPNTTGTPKTEDYNLGRGILYAAPLDAGGLPEAYRDLGNAPSMNITLDTENLEHLVSRAGLKTVDKDIVISQKLAVAFTLDEFNDENLADLFSGAKATHTNVAVAGFAEWAMVPAGKIVKGRYYDIRNSSGERAYDVKTADLVVKSSNATPVTMVDGTDYTLDSEMGRIFLLSTSTKLDTAITGSEGLDITLTARAGAGAVDEVQSLTKSGVVVALKFIADNPAASGKKKEYQFHQITLKADGDLSLIGDEWSEMQFSGSAEKNTGADSASPTLTVRNVTPA